MNPIRLAIADDHKGVLDMFAYFLQNEHRYPVLIKAVNGRNLIRALNKKTVDIVILDIQMTVLNGKETCKIIYEKFPQIKIIAYTFYKEKNIIAEMIQAGATGFVCKESGVQEIIKAIRSVMKGEIYISKSIKCTKPKSSVTLSRNTVNSYGITNKEISILELIEQGFSGKEISNMLNIKYRTVESHKRNLFRKTGVRTTVKLIAFARSNGIIE